MPFAHHASFGGSRWHARQRRQQVSFDERGWTLRGVQFGGDKSCVWRTRRGQVYLRDTCVGAADPSCKPSTQLVSADSEGALVGTESILPSVSASGRFVAFLAVTPSHGTASAKASGQAKTSAATVEGANSGYRQVFVRDTCLGAANCTPKTTRISLQPGDSAGSNAKPAGPALSGSSSRVALSGANSATVFTRSVAVDDRAFLALTAKSQ